MPNNVDDPMPDNVESDSRCMPENSASSDYDLMARAPRALSDADRAACISLIKDGGAVDPWSAERELPEATWVVTARKDNRIIGVGVIKQIRCNYALDKAKKSGVNFPPETHELGYVAVDSGHQGKGLSHCIVAELISKHEEPLFATTSSAPMKKTLKKPGFEQRGHEWEGKSENQLSLWLKGI